MTRFCADVYKRQVLMVGGSSRIPAVQEAIQKFMGKEPFKGINPDHGANEGTPFEKLVEALKIYILALLRLQEIDL